MRQQSNEIEQLKSEKQILGQSVGWMCGHKATLLLGWLSNGNFTLIRTFAVSIIPRVYPQTPHARSFDGRRSQGVLVSGVDLMHETSLGEIIVDVIQSLYMHRNSHHACTTKTILYILAPQARLRKKFSRLRKATLERNASGYVSFEDTMSPTVNSESTEGPSKARIDSSENEESDTDDDDAVLDKHLKERQHVKVGNGDGGGSG